MPTLICDCNRTMPLSAKALGQALHEDLTLHSTLCRREAGAFQKAIQSGEDVIVACTQEKRLFAELGRADRRRDLTSSVLSTSARLADGAVMPRRPRPRSRPCWRPRD
jgi:hypothetical protein